MEKKFVSHINKPLLMQFGIHKPEECIMIGDHLKLDIDCARKFGINTIWVNSENIVQNSIPTISVNNISQINEDLITSLIPTNS